MNRRVLVTGIGKRNHLIRLLKSECDQLGATLVGGDAAEFPPAFPEVEEFYQLPLVTDPEFPGAYRNLVINADIDVCLTLIDPEIPILAELDESNSLGKVRTLHPPSTTSQVCQDKLAFAERLDRENLPAILTSSTPLAVFPQIVKDRWGSAASGFRIIETESEIPNNVTDRMIFQPYINGSHYCIDAVADDDGILLDMLVKEVLNKINGESYLLRSVDRTEFVDLIASISSRLQLRGIFNLDIYRVGTELVCMEVNCRIGGNYPVTHTLGVNLLRSALQIALLGQSASPTFVSYPIDRYVGKYFSFTDPFGG